MATERYYWIDVIKALAITLVVLFHSGFCHYIPFFPILAMCVPLFFVANGILILHKDRDLKYYLCKICKIVFLMFLWSTIQTCVTMFYNQDQFILTDIYNSVITQRMHYCNTFWFMGTLAVLYLLYPIIFAFINKRHSNIWYVLILTYFLSFKAFGYTLPIGPIPNFLHFWQSEALFYAVAGLFIFKNRNNAYMSKIKNWQIILAIIILGSMPLLAYTNIEFFTRHMPGDPVFSLYQSPFVMLMTVLVVLLIQRTNFNEHKIVSLLGQNTLGIYCLHPSIMRALRYYLEIDNDIVKSGIIFFGALFLSFFISIILQKNKYTRFFVNL